MDLPEDFFVCFICREEYSWDVGSADQSMRCHLPVQSQACSHTVCYGCTLQYQNAQSERKKQVVKWLKCLTCDAKTAFCPEKPVWNRMLCGIIEVRQQSRTSSASETSTGQDEEESDGLGAAVNSTSSRSGEVPTERQSTRESNPSKKRTKKRKKDETSRRVFDGEQISTQPTTRASSSGTTTALSTAPESTDTEASSNSASSYVGDNQASTSHTAEVWVKTERDIIMKQVVEHRRYGDRVLLGRQRMNGMMKLGGGNCRMDLFPKNDPNHPRFQAIGNRRAIAYNDSWQPFGPKYAGQQSAHVGCTPENLEHPGDAFSVFMRRGDLGWEYCGDYRSADPERDIITYTAAHHVKKKDKKRMAHDIKDSLRRPGGQWHSITKKMRSKLNDELLTDSSPAGPRWLIEKRMPTEQEAKEKPASLAARARALGYTPDISNDAFAELVVELDERHESEPITFVEYVEDVYNYVKAGETTRTSAGKTRQPGERCALASDWYAKLDQQVQ